MSSKSFLARWDMYFNSRGEDTKKENTELPSNPLAEEDEIDSPIVEVTKLEDAKSLS